MFAHVASEQLGSTLFVAVVSTILRRSATETAKHGLRASRVQHAHDWKAQPVAIAHAPTDLLTRRDSATGRSAHEYMVCVSATALLSSFSWAVQLAGHDEDNYDDDWRTPRYVRAPSTTTTSATLSMRGAR